MATTFGGETPDVKYGLEITVEAPDGTSTATPVEQGDLFKLGASSDLDSDGSGYKLVPLVADDNPATCVMVMAKHRMTEVREMGVKVLGGYHQIRRLRYVSGAAPTIGQSVAATAGNLRRIKGIAFANGAGRVCKVNTGDLDADVLN
jgi:hypothetical protein